MYISIHLLRIVKVSAVLKIILPRILYNQRRLTMKRLNKLFRVPESQNNIKSLNYLLKIKIHRVINLQKMYS